MRLRTVIQIFALLAAWILPCTGVAAGESAAEQNAKRATELLFGPNSEDAQKNEGLLLLLDAVAETAPDAGLNAEWRSKLAEARQRIREGKVADGQATALLDSCYREIHGGASYRVPDSVRTIEDAIRHGRRELESATRLLAQKKAADALQRMLEAVMVVLTPIERQQ